jgi:hypothetical protein
LVQSPPWLWGTEEAETNLIPLDPGMGTDPALEGIRDEATITAGRDAVGPLSIANDSRSQDHSRDFMTRMISPPPSYSERSRRI